MAYDRGLADRVRRLAGGAGEKPMFGSLGFFVGDRLALAVHGDGLLVRVGAQAQPAALGEPGVERAVMGTREMHGWVRVAAAVLDDETLRRWWARATDATAAAD